MMDGKERRKADQSSKTRHQIVAECSLGPSLLREGPPGQSCCYGDKGRLSYSTSVHRLGLPSSELSCPSFSVSLSVC